ncbi:glycoside hydrolase family 19 protein [Sphingomonas nostoxanthinifaciens]|uniref:glycoside hydrolase family 19 protein n=1 Tax=Sphingomonas nostoxanthinifaciens TaxID=2872652 RepID=UPI001CC1EF09|nr:glycoside hydrolase family 19 protein [Sphingomonas nostoxanthinifaciens]UAK24171.1 hypothetical protein K8P63_17870 [Sphingomonas nostoxanthinifaciens]
MIDWKGIAQPALSRAGYYAGATDGDDGPKTYTAVFAYAAQRPADITIAAIGMAAAKWIKGDPIAQTPARLAEFVAQTCNETGGFTRFEEDLRYSAAALLAQWPTHFTAAQAAACVGRPVDIACRAYGGRMGNVAPPAKDGWLYRGRGMLQLTGKAAYARFGQLVGLDLVGNPDLAADPADSLVIAREFWRAAGVNAAVDAGNFAKARQLTNGGSIGLANVAAIRARLLRVLA